MKTIIFIPVSRHQYLQALFANLEMLDCDRDKTNLLIMVDGDAELYLKVRNFTGLSKFNERLCVQWQSKHKLKHYDIAGRRMRISDIHNDSKQYIGDCDFIFGLEDDTLFPNNTLKKLIAAYGRFPYAGFIQGVQLGRWGIPYIGAWQVDNIYNPTKITSLESKQNNEKKEIEPIDAGGFYCYLTRREQYLGHDYKPFDKNGLGPDVDFGIAQRQAGLQNYIDWSIETTHKTKDKDIKLSNTTPKVINFVKNEQGRWRQSNKSI